MRVMRSSGLDLPGLVAVFALSSGLDDVALDGAEDMLRCVAKKSQWRRLLLLLLWRIHHLRSWILCWLSSLHILHRVFAALASGLLRGSVRWRRLELLVLMFLHVVVVLELWRLSRGRAV